MRRSKRFPETQVNFKIQRENSENNMFKGGEYKKSNDRPVGCGDRRWRRRRGGGRIAKRSNAHAAIGPKHL